MPTRPALRPKPGDIVRARSTHSLARVLDIKLRDPFASRFHVRIIDPLGHHKKGDMLVWTPDMITPVA